MKTGFTTITFRKKTIDENIEIAKKANVCGIEWGGDVHVLPGDVQTAASVALKMKKNNLVTLSYGSYYKTEYETADGFIPVIESARVLGAPIIRVWAGSKGPKTADEAQFNRVVKNAQAIADEAAKYGLTVAFEYHRNTLTENVESAMKLLKAIDRPNFKTYWQPNPDITIEDNIRELDTIKDYVVTIHAFYWTPDRALMREGMDIWNKYLNVVKGRDDINIVLEFCKDDADDSFLSDMDAIREMVLPRSIFCVSENVKAIDNAYDEVTRAALRQLTYITDEVYTVKKFENEPECGKDVKYLFSTWGMPTFNEEQIKKYLPDLECVFYAAGSVQPFARPFIDLGVKVFSAWGANGVPVAEVAAAEIILANKGFYGAQQYSKRGDRSGASAYYSRFPGNYNCKVGIIGAGMIGSYVCNILKGYDVEVLVFDPFASDEKLEALGAKRATLEELFSQCQTISNHLANNANTVGVLNYDLFSRMLPNATFINTGRGAQVVEADLVRALKEEPERTAVLDVTMPEPPVEGHEFYSLPNVVLTPHLAGSFNNEVARMGKYMCDEFTAHVKNEPTKYEVSAKMLETMA